MTTKAEFYQAVREYIGYDSEAGPSTDRLARLAREFNLSMPSACRWAMGKSAPATDALRKVVVDFMKGLPRMEPCEECGSHQVVCRSYVGPKFYQVSCKSCGNQGTTQSRESYAITAWNERTPKHGS